MLTAVLPLVCISLLRVDGHDDVSAFYSTLPPCGAAAVARRLQYDPRSFPLNSAFDVGASLVDPPPSTRHDAHPQASATRLKGKAARAVAAQATARDTLARASFLYAKRIEAQMALYRAEPLFGLLENKLLVKLALEFLGVPFVEPIYGALARQKPLVGADGNGDGGQARLPPVYSRDALANATLSWPWWRSHAFVLKGATDGQSNRVTVWDARSSGLVSIKLQERDGSGGRGAPPRHHNLERDAAAYTTVQLATRAERYMNTSSGWGQKHERRGVVLEVTDLSDSRKTHLR